MVVMTVPRIMGDLPRDKHQHPPPTLGFGLTVEEVEAEIDKVTFNCGGSCQTKCGNCKNGFGLRLKRALKATAHLVDGKLFALLKAVKRAQTNQA